MKVILEWCLLAAFLLGMLTQTAAEDMMMNGTEAPAMEDDDDMEIPSELPDMGDGLGATPLPTGTAVPTMTEDGCWANTDDIFAVISNDDLLFQQKRFVLCPNSVMELGFIVPGVGVERGLSPLVARSNTEFLCGEDGKIENNCTLLGGDFGLVAVPIFFAQDLGVNNVVVRGFTFVGQLQFSYFSAVQGDLLIEDCIFKDQANFGPVVFSYDSFFEDLIRRDRRFLVEDYNNPWDAFLEFKDALMQFQEDKEQRRLAGDSGEEEEQQALVSSQSGGKENDQRELQTRRFVGTFRNILFIDNSQVARQPGVEFGIITIKTGDHDVLLDGCTFANNNYGEAPQGYAIQIIQAPMLIRGCCFVDNDFRGEAPIILLQTGDPNEALIGNYATEDDDFVQCGLAAHYATAADRENFNSVCIESQEDECLGPEELDLLPFPELVEPPPPASPTPGPVAVTDGEPTPAPDSGDETSDNGNTGLPSGAAFWQSSLSLTLFAMGVTLFVGFP